MINIFDKLAILYYINKAETDVYYDCYKNSSLRRIRINNDAFISIDSYKDYDFNPRYVLRYHLPNKPEYNIKPNQQSYWDKLFIQKMYSKMFNNYLAKHNLTNSK